MRVNLLACLIMLLSISGYSQKFIPGYQKTIIGGGFSYHGPQPDAGKAMLVRSNKLRPEIEWLTAPVPEESAGEQIRFLMLAAIDVNPDDPQSWEVLVDGSKHFTIHSPTDTLRKEIAWTGPAKSSLVFKATGTDRYGDMTGYLILTLTPDPSMAGRQLNISIYGKKQRSSTWFMVYEYETINRVNISSQPAVTQGPTGKEQILRIEITRYDDPVSDAKFEAGASTFYKDLAFGYNNYYVSIPAISKATNIPVRVTAGHDLIVNETALLEPVKQMTIHLLPHSHVDIGYTHTQDEVEKMQWAHLEEAVRLARQNHAFPAEARFKWNTEVWWAVDSYLNQADENQKAAFMDAVKKGWIEINGMYANMLTGLCSEEELFRLFDMHAVTELQDYRSKSVMISDIPGWSWGIVPVMAASGIRYLSCGPNSGHRTGDILEVLGDKPFYWVAPSGTDSILTWVHGAGYSYFHTGLGAENYKNLLSEGKIFGYLDQLTGEQYPYDIATLRYNIGSDNGPPDGNLSQIVHNWNDRYVTPKLVVSTVKEAFSEFEERYGETLPSRTGEITGYWEDGAASTARETALNRENAASLSQMETLMAMLGNRNYDEQVFWNIWKKIMLYDEHTWGAWNSISEPGSDFVRQQWQTKKAFAEDARHEITLLQQDAVKFFGGNEKDPAALMVINTGSWARSEWVNVPDLTNKFVTITDEKGRQVKTIRNPVTNLMLFAEDIPAFGSRVYYVDKDPEPAKATKKTDEYRLSGRDISLDIDPESGSITSLTRRGIRHDLASSSHYGLNQYIYTNGRNPDSMQFARLKSVSVPGPDIMILEYDAPGCTSLQTTIMLSDESGSILISNKLNKEEISDAEAVRFAFPFNIPNGEVRYDIAFATINPQTDLLPGANRNFTCIQSYVDISNKDMGITWISPDAPLVELGQPMNDAVVFGYQDDPPFSPTLFSYAMNNYWETNYKASQSGMVTFTYHIRFHDEYEQASAKKAGMEARMPMMVFPVSKNAKAIEPIFVIDNPNIIAFAARPLGKGIIISLQNCTGQPQELKLKKLPETFWLTSFDGRSKRPVENEINFPSYSIRHLYLEPEDRQAPSGAEKRRM